MELLHDDLVEHILEKLPVKSLLRFKLVSIQWKSIIESRYFKKKHLICRQSQDPDILIINPLEFPDRSISDRNGTTMFTMSSSDLIKIPILFPPCKQTPLENELGLPYHDTYSVSGSCDGMICYYNHDNCIYVVNPITRWFRNVPQARYQAVILDTLNRGRWNFDVYYLRLYSLGFGKDKFTDTYKMVWLYNSSELGLENATTCEVFDFSTNTWKYVTAAPCRILDHHIPVYVDGSLYWFTDEYIGETRVLSFNLQTETFHIVLKTPFFEVLFANIVMCNLNDRLCISAKKRLRQEIWLLNNSDMIWEKIYYLNLETDPELFSEGFGYNPDIVINPYTIFCVIPVAVLKKKKSLVLFDVHVEDRNLTIYDPELRSYDACFQTKFKLNFRSTVMSFSPSLISIEEN